MKHLKIFEEFEYNYPKSKVGYKLGNEPQKSRWTSTSTEENLPNEPIEPDEDINMPKYDYTYNQPQQFPSPANRSNIERSGIRRITDDDIKKRHSFFKSKEEKLNIRFDNVLNSWNNFNNYSNQKYFNEFLNSCVKWGEVALLILKNPNNENIETIRKMGNKLIEFLSGEFEGKVDLEVLNKLQTILTKIDNIIKLG